MLLKKFKYYWHLIKWSYIDFTDVEWLKNVVTIYRNEKNSNNKETNIVFDYTVNYG